ncbi:serine/threonine-protein kinase MARK2-like [Ochotona princeps]|uniref:serine/threonine-protein kinase MARK2-like n=1 Tax=Ochotona princeps TaxID=9978 RepID=UPI002714B841|nr:serine/threonine-protein kinase MARK2-like [Ochotona princeps]XP_058534975.1 serine/threonine-protein kinase MARK2-like [Ochotona princeps]
MQGPSGFPREADILDGYRFLGFIGHGSFSEVRLACHLGTGTEVAVKIVRRDPGDTSSLQRLLAEVDIMKDMCHPNILQLLEVRHSAACSYLVLEYASRGELRRYVAERGHLWEEEACFLFCQTLSAVHYCHRHSVVHRDLKLGNLLLDANLHIKLADFGLSCRITEGQQLDTFCGTPQYCAPEMFLHKSYDGFKADVWSLGVILYTMLMGSLPFHGKNQQELGACVLRGRYLLPGHISSALQELLRKLLSLNPNERPTVQEIRGHWWLGWGAEEPEITDVEPLSSAQDPETQEDLAGLDLDPGYGEEALSGSHCDATLYTTLLSQKDYPRVKPTPLAELSSASIDVCSPHVLQPQGKTPVSLRPSSQPPLSQGNQEGKLQAYSRAPIPDPAQCGQLQLLSPGPGPGAAPCALSPRSPEGHLAEGGHPQGVAEQEAVPREQPGLEAGTPAPAGDGSQAHRSVGRRLVEFLLRVCCILPTSEAGPGTPKGKGAPR